MVTSAKSQTFLNGYVNSIADVTRQLDMLGVQHQSIPTMLNSLEDAKQIYFNLSKTLEAYVQKNSKFKMLSNDPTAIII